jgi:hypothetical protein
MLKPAQENDKANLSHQQGIEKQVIGSKLKQEENKAKLEPNKGGSILDKVKVKEVNVEVEFHQSAMTREITMSTRISESEVMAQAMPELILREAARLIAERLVAEKYQEIVALIDSQAIANLTVAEAAVAINKTLKEKIPDKIVEIERTKREVYQRGVFGGLQRIG